MARGLIRKLMEWAWGIILMSTITYTYTFVGARPVLRSKDMLFWLLAIVSKKCTF